MIRSIVFSGWGLRRFGSARASHKTSSTSGGNASAIEGRSPPIVKSISDKIIEVSDAAQQQQRVGGLLEMTFLAEDGASGEVYLFGGDWIIEFQ